MNPFPSRLPNVGTTIFTVMSRLASEHGAINLSQGFPDFSPPPLLLERAAHHMQAGANQYPPMAGVVPLREAIAEKVEPLYGAAYDVENEITSRPVRPARCGKRRTGRPWRRKAVLRLFE